MKEKANIIFAFMCLSMSSIALHPYRLSVFPEYRKAHQLANKTFI
jgi:hypothetical protein